MAVASYQDSFSLRSSGRHRRDDTGRRSVYQKKSLLCTEKAAPIIAQGRVLQHSFAEQLASGLSEEDLAHFRRCIAVFDRNIERIRTETCKRRETQP